MEDYNSAYSGAQIDEAARIAAANQSPFTATLFAVNWANADVFGKRTNVASSIVDLNTVTFKSALSNAPALKTFTYSSAAASWQLSGANVSLATYGISLTGTPTNGNVIVAEYAVRKVQTLVITGVSADHTLTCGLRFAEDGVPSEEAAQAAAWALVIKYLIGTNSITFYCGDTAPTIDVSIQLWEA
ncbi:MAG TPA: hypothetical protein VN538_05070 [Clostridia bacterium]|nr:hypothetical protein [Clostridia bacterium]